MRWSDSGIVLGGRPLGEANVIANIFTEAHGRVQGLVKGGRSRRIRPILQTGNVVLAEWRARLDEQLGVFTVELEQAIAATALDNRLALLGVASLASLLQLLPERDPHPKLFLEALDCLRQAGSERFAAAVIFFELRFLEEIGFGLNLKECAATGTRDNLAYVSPRSGQAVCALAGEPYRDRLLHLPDFLRSEPPKDSPNAGELAAALELTGYFLKLHLLGDPGASLSNSREEFARLLRSGITRE